MNLFFKYLIFSVIKLIFDLHFFKCCWRLRKEGFGQASLFVDSENSITFMKINKQTMYNTKYGAFDGDSWESVMQTCFRLKYENEQYQFIPAISGDYGIEGFTKNGKVFQCYCPDNNLGSKELYEKQRSKVTDDLKKLSLYQTQLVKILNGVKIKEWILVTPDYRMKELILHCNLKKDEILKMNLPFIDKDFKVLVHDIDNFAIELPTALNADGKKLLIDKPKLKDKSVIKWKDTEIDLVTNVIRKHTKRFNDNAKEVDDKVNKLTDATIESFLDQNSILSRWRQLHPEDYEKYLILISQIEKEVEEICMFPAEDNNKRYVELRDLVRGKLKENFGYLNDITLSNLTNGAVADWLIRCPLDFE